MVISSLAAGFSDGKNQKYSSRVSFGSDEIGRRPAYDSPISKSTSGIAVPSTANSRTILVAYYSRTLDVIAIVKVFDSMSRTVGGALLFRETD